MRILGYCFVTRRFILPRDSWYSRNFSGWDFGMKKYDVLIIGSGAGMNVADNAYRNRMTVAVIEHREMGGVCLNRGCIPTKILTYPADVIQTIRTAGKLGITAQIDKIDFQGIMECMRREISHDSQQQGRGVDAAPGMDWYKEIGEFIDDFTLKSGKDTITAPLVFIVSGARPYIPPIQGLDDINYLDSKTALDLDERPASMIIVSGGYIAAEYGHFFDSVGTNVTILGRNPQFVAQEDLEVSQLLLHEFGKRVKIRTNHEVLEAQQTPSGVTVKAQDRASGTMSEFSAETLLLAAGRIPNSDLLKPEKTGVDTDAREYVKVNEFLQTNVENIWAFGDAIGKHMFRHVANYEAEIAWYNAQSLLHPEQSHAHGAGDNSPQLIPVNYSAVPKAVFSFPQVASVGLTPHQAKEQGFQIHVGVAEYKNSAKGMAMVNPPGFVKVVVDQKTRRILGAHIIGQFAPILIQEIINVMNSADGSYIPIFQAMHIHPALLEVVVRAFGSLAPA